MIPAGISCRHSGDISIVKIYNVAIICHRVFGYESKKPVKKIKIILSAA